MTRVFVESIGLMAPGLHSWQQGKTVLDGSQPYVDEPVPRLMPDLLPATERRRASNSTRLAVQVAGEALRDRDLDVSNLATVFVACESDNDIIHNLCSNLATDEKVISPTRFHNSVHNAPAGYWHIAAQSRGGSGSLCAWEASFAVGLVDAAVQCTVEQRPVLLCAYDTVVPPPLVGARPTPVTIPFATALLLRHHKPGQYLASLELALQQDSAEASKSGIEALDNMVSLNPIARSLPLLCAIAKSREQTVRMDYSDTKQACIKLVGAT